MFFHASQTPNIKVLTPSISNHGKPLIYFTQKRENALVYLSNAVEKYCKESGIKHQGVYKTWASYGFNKNGILELDEYYPNATEDTYKGVSGFIYSAEKIGDYQEMTDIPFAVTCENPVTVENCEFIPDSYEAILKSAQQGDIILKRFDENNLAKLEWIKKTITDEYKNSISSPEYRMFLKAKFDFI